MSFLHVFHHATVVGMAWLWVDQVQSLTFIGIMANTLVHVRSSPPLELSSPRVCTAYASCYCTKGVLHGRLVSVTPRGSGACTLLTAPLKEQYQCIRVFTVQRCTSRLSAWPSCVLRMLRLCCYLWVIPYLQVHMAAFNQADPHMVTCLPLFCQL